MSSWIEVFGRLHPLVLHLPIGALVGLLLLEAAAAMRRRSGGEAAAVLVWLSAAAAILAAGTGYVLSRESGYGGAALTRHLQLGIALAGASLATAVLRARWGPSAAYRLALLATVALMFPAAHLGATITHGEGFVTAPLQPQTRTPRKQAPSTDPAADSTASPPEAAAADSVYARSIAPIFAERCTSCHGENKTKGDLALHTPEAIAAGGESGPVFVAGQPQDSEIIRRLRLPLDDRDHMPPKDKPQLTPEQIEAIERWIAEGGRFDGSGGPAHVTAPSTGSPPEPDGHASSTDPALAAAAIEPPAAPRPSPPPPPAPATIAALRSRLVNVEVLAQDSNELLVDFSAPASQTGDEEVTALLSPLTPNIVELSLSRTAVTDAVMPLLAQMPNLRRLDLRRTSITDEGLAKLAGHAGLSELVLTQMQLTDAAVDTLLALPALQRLYVWNSGLSADAIANLRSRRPAMLIDAGDSPDAAALEAEAAVQLGKPASAQAAGATATLAPVNAVCPVTGKPVDPRYAIVSGGRVIGFCCPNCPGEFWANPGKYEVKP